MTQRDTSKMPWISCQRTEKKVSGTTYKNCSSLLPRDPSFPLTYLIFLFFPHALNDNVRFFLVYSWGNQIGRDLLSFLRWQRNIKEGGEWDISDSGPYTYFNKTFVSPMDSDFHVRASFFLIFLMFVILIQWRWAYCANVLSH